MAVVLKPGVSGDDDEKQKLLSYLKENVAPYKVPKVVEFLHELPRTSTGKIQRFKLS